MSSNTATEEDGSTPARPGWLRARAPWQRALLLYGVLLLFGILGVPLLVWVAGNRVLGPYVHGQDLHAGPFALLSDFLVGLGHGSAVFWGVALGPAVLILLLRLFLRGLRRLPRAAGRS
ncbi:MAG TPA: hypothetical protein VL994_06365 [Steroidobacteraceae bacterium]|nr:hypothetical protein [Steroidobacteraceae bacterium]